jgi:hypothetical protein
LGVATGLAGGAAEIAWVGFYGAATGTPVAGVARGVTAALGLSGVPHAAALGIALHMLLAVMLGVAVVAAFRSSLLSSINAWSQSALVVLTLAVVWSVNFLLVLPHLDPAFLTLLPVAVTLTSKLLFGVSAAAVLRSQRSTRVGAF